MPFRRIEVESKPLLMSGGAAKANCALRARVDKRKALEVTSRLMGTLFEREWVGRVQPVTANVVTKQLFGNPPVGLVQMDGLSLPGLSDYWSFIELGLPITAPGKSVLEVYLDNFITSCFQYRQLTHHRKICSPGTYFLPVAFGHYAGHLQDVPQVVCCPGGQ